MWQARGKKGGRRGGSGCSVSRVSCPREAKDGGAAAGSAHVSPPAPAPSSAGRSLLLLPPSCQSSPETSSVASPAGTRCFADLGPQSGYEGKMGVWGAVRGRFLLDAELLWLAFC